MNKLTVTIPVDNQAMALYTAWPTGTGAFPAIVAIMHAGGVDTFMQDIASRLVEAGYFVAVPDLYHRLDSREGNMLDRMAKLRDPSVELDVNATVDFLRGHSAVDSNRLGIIGYCMGGRVAYMMAARNPHFRAVVTYYGGNIMKAWGDGPAPFSLSSELNCPMLFHFGDEDTNPSPADREKLDSELNRLNKPHTFYTYEGAGHAFMNVTNAERYRENASQQSWPRTLAFFAKELTKELAG